MNITDDPIQLRLNSCLIGAAVGDSLGLPYEGMSSSTGKNYSVFLINKNCYLALEW